MPRDRGVPEEGGRIGETGMVEKFLGKSHPRNWGLIEGLKRAREQSQPVMRRASCCGSQKCSV